MWYIQGMKAYDVAKYFLTLQEDDARDISNLKLQKLLYYAQGYHLALFARPLFDDRIEAWIHGPVVPAIYFQYKNHGGEPIPPPDDFDSALHDCETIEFLDEVYGAVGQFTAWKLREMTHAEPPWKEAFNPGDPGDISHDAMRSYFSTLVN